MKKFYFLGIVMIIVLLGIGGLGLYKSFTKEKLQFVTININPDVELAVNSDNEIVEVIPVNEDAEIMISDLDLVGLDVEAASTLIIDEAIEMGYIDEYSDENAVMIGAYGDNEEKRTDLETKIINKLNSHFETRKVYAVLVAKGLSDELKQEADNYGISNGKMLLVAEAVALNPELKKEQLVDMSIREIQGEIKSYVTDRREALKTTMTQARETWKQEKAELKVETRAKVEEFKAGILDEQKEVYRNLTADEKREVIDTLLEEKRKQLKESVNEIKEEIKQDVKETTDNYNYPVVENNLDAIKERIKDRKNR